MTHYAVRYTMISPSGMKAATKGSCVLSADNDAAALLAAKAHADGFYGVKQGQLRVQIDDVEALPSR